MSVAPPRAAASVEPWQGAAAVVLRAGDSEAVVLPSLGMLVASFVHQGRELVALRGGLRGWRAGHTTGIPLLYPWANRLSRHRYRVGKGTRVTEVDLRGLDLHTDFDAEYPYAEVYAPSGKPFCALEPMTAPTNSLVTSDHPVVRPGAVFAAGFTIAV